jgi:hypothetical protein
MQNLSALKKVVKVVTIKEEMTLTWLQNQEPAPNAIFILNASALFEGIQVGIECK